MKLKEIVPPHVEVVDHAPTDGFWFQHESPHKLVRINVLTYDELENIRDKKYPIDNRKHVEDEYRKLTHSPDDKTFVYATPVQYNMMEDPDQYPGYTYYFKMSNAQVDKCVFDIIDKKKWMDASIGRDGLAKAIKIFNEHRSEFKPYDDPEVGTIYPRIEIAIPFDIVPTLVYPQEEDR